MMMMKLRRRDSRAGDSWESTNTRGKIWPTVGKKIIAMNDVVNTHFSFLSSNFLFFSLLLSTLYSIFHFHQKSKI